MCLCVIYKDGWRSTGGESGKHKEDKQGQRQGGVGGIGEGRGGEGGSEKATTTATTSTITQIKSTQEVVHNINPKGIDKGTLGRSDSTHTAVWATVALFEPVCSTSDRGKESFAAQLVIDVVPSLGGYCYILFFSSFLFCFVLFYSVLFYSFPLILLCYVVLDLVLPCLALVLSFAFLFCFVLF